MKIKCSKCGIVNNINEEQAKHSTELIITCFVCNTLNTITIDKADDIRCPKCSSNQVTANRKGFNDDKSLIGRLRTAGNNLFAGIKGSSEMKITCLNCRHVFDSPDKGS